jgi:rod shape-determining protein MreB
MLARLFGLVSTDLAIDLGTANTLVYVPNVGIVLDEPSVVAMATIDGEKRAFVVGNEAKDMLGKMPGNI